MVGVIRRARYGLNYFLKKSINAKDRNVTKQAATGSV
jgi:uncharacterized membrane protein